jgi:glycosyltransferase involved in cell wall biosynthesis
VRPGAFDGAATYTLNVLRFLPELLGEARILVLCREGETRLQQAPNVELRSVAIRSAARRATYEMVAVSRLRADVFVSPNESLPLRVPGRAVVVAQNLAYHCARSPESYRGGTPQQRIGAALQRSYYRRRMPEAYRRAAVVVAISRTAAELLSRDAGLPLERTIVALGGSDSMFIESDASTPDRDRLLVVSAVAPYKNFNSLIDALAHVRRTHPRVRVEIAGPDWRGYRAVVEARAARAGVSDAVRFLGAVPPRKVAGLYASSAALLHLSDCEACPLPPLEAMRAGLPVVAARRSSIPEVVGDGAVLVEPDDADAVADVIRELLDDDAARAALARRGRARADELTWRATASGVAEAVRRAAA